MTSWESFLMGTVIFFYAVTVLEVVQCHFFFRRKKKSLPPNFRPKVSILKALKGVDEGMYENFVSFCHLTYPNYELVFSVVDHDDEAIPLVQKLQREYPQVNIRLVVNSREIGHNPQMSNFHNGYEGSNGEVVIFSDSDTRVDPDFVETFIAPLADAGVGIVSGLPLYRRYQNFWAGAKGTCYSTNVILFDILVHRCVQFAIGAAMAVRRETFDAVGGFSTIVNRITTDQELGKLFARNGYRCELIPCLISMFDPRTRLRDEVALVLRWMRAIRSSEPYYYLLIPLSFGTFYYTVFLLLNPFSGFYWALWLAVVLLRFLLPLYMTRTFFREPSMRRYAWTLPLVDMLVPLLWVASYGSRKVIWRQHAYWLKRHGEMVPMELGTPRPVRGEPVEP